jgi:hypothetical protein
MRSDCIYDPDLAAIGLIEPYFTDELVGYATRRVVHDGPLICCYINEHDGIPTHALDWHYEDIDPVPQYRTVLRWREVSDV